MGQSLSSYIDTLSPTPSTHSVNMSHCNYFALNQSAKRINTGFISRKVTFEQNKMASYDVSEQGMDFINNTFSVQHEYLNSNPVSPLLIEQQSVNRRMSIGIEQSMTAKASSPPFCTQSPVDAIKQKMDRIMDKLQIAQHARLAMMKLTEHKKLQMILEFDFMERSQMLNENNKNKRFIFFK